MGVANADEEDGIWPFVFADVKDGSLGGTCGVAVDSEHVFWVDKNGGAIGRANLDGTDPDYSFIGGADEPCGVAVDDSHIYWANFGGNSIGRARLDGTDVNQEFISGTTRPCGVAVNNRSLFWASADGNYIGRALLAGPTRGPNLYEQTSDYYFCGVAASSEHVYWGGYGGFLGRVGVDGSEPEPEFIEGVEAACDVAVHGDHLFWTSYSYGHGPARVGDGRISRANLDGSDIDLDVIDGLRFPCGIAVDSRVLPPPPPPPPPLLNWTPCSIAELKLNRRRGIAFVRVDGPAFGHISVRARGLRWQIVSKKPPSSAGLSSWRWWMKVRPRGKGRMSRRIRRRLRRNGRAAVRFRVRCSEEGHVSASDSRRFVLRRLVHHRRSGHRRPAGRRP